MGRTNGYSRRASKDKQIFGLDLLLSEDIPGVQMTFPPVTLPAPLTAPPPKRKTPAGVPGMVESTKAFGMICMAVFSARGVQCIVIWDRDASVACSCWTAAWDVKTLESDRDGLIPSLTDGETDARREDGTCRVAG